MGGPQTKHHIEKIAFNHLKKVIDKYNILDKNSSVLIGLSGGIDSFVLVDLLHRYNQKFNSGWEIYAAHVNPGFENWQTARIETFLQRRGLKYKIINAPIKDKLATIDKNRCFFCSRLRRRYLVEHADALSIKTIALAHHKEDVAETLLLNLLYTRAFSTMVPRQSILQGRFFFIRPLYFFEKETIKNFAQVHGFRAVTNKCPYARKSTREEIRRFLKKLTRRDKRIIDNIFYGITRIKSQYLP